MASAMSKARAAARRGAKLMDKEKPGWYKPRRFSLKRFNIADCDVCVLGQHYANGTNGYDRGIEILGLTQEMGWKPGTPSWFGFNVPMDEYGYQDVVTDEGAVWSEDRAYAALQTAWEEEIRARRAK